MTYQNPAMAPMKRAMGELILLALHEMGPVEHDRGRVPTLLRELCDVPNVPSATALMSELNIAFGNEGLITRLKTEGGRGTLRIELKGELAEEHLQKLKANEAANRQLMRSFIRWEREHLDKTVESIVSDCVRTLQRIRQVAASPDTEQKDGQYALNMSAIQRSVGLSPHQGRMAATLLKKSGYIKAGGEFDNFLKWWDVDTVNDLDQKKVAAAARSTIENAIQRAITDETAKSAQSSDQAADVDEQVSSPEAAKNEVQPTREAGATAKESGESEQSQPKSRLGQLLEVIDRLNKAKAALDNRNSELILENQQLTTQNRELRGENERLTEENNTLRIEKQGLQEKIRQYDEEMRLADDILKKFQD